MFTGPLWTLVELRGRSAFMPNPRIPAALVGIFFLTTVLGKVGHGMENMFPKSSSPKLLVTSGHYTPGTCVCVCVSVTVSDGLNDSGAQ